MLIKASSINGFTIAATDGTIGTVSDLLFDDASWTVRWLVVETGNWLSNRQVLLPAVALGHPDMTARSFPVRRTMAEVKSSPDVDTHLPVSRQYEVSSYNYYGLDPYWGTGEYMGGYGYWNGMLAMPPAPPTTPRRDEIDRMKRNADDPHLRSVAVLRGYHIHATDGEIGHLADFLIDDGDWSLRYLVIDTSNWWQGKEVLISPKSTQDIRWTEQLIYLGVNRDRIRNSPDYDPFNPPSPAFDASMADHYSPRQPAKVD